MIFLESNMSKHFSYTLYSVVIHPKEICKERWQGMTYDHARFSGGAKPNFYVGKMNFVRPFSDTREPILWEKSFQFPFY